MSVYVMSDIHGLSDKFERALKELDLKKEDKVFILGDVIDRGPDGIKILQKVMEDDRFILLLGNHELMMYKYLTTRDNYDRALWFLNGGQVTLQAYELLEEDEKERIYLYLKELPVSIPDVRVNRRYFCLVHSMWLDLDVEKVSYFKGNWERYSDVVWHRENEISELYYRFVPEKRIVIAGHTPVVYLGGSDRILGNDPVLRNCRYIDIDCGCSGGPSGKLAVLRLSDYKEWYF